VHFDDFSFARNMRDGILTGPDTVCADYSTTTEIEASRHAVLSWFNGSFKEINSSIPESEFPATAKSTWDALEKLPAVEQPARVAELRGKACPE
jgi:hypothetical protein